MLCSHLVYERRDPKITDALHALGGTFIRARINPFRRTRFDKMDRGGQRRGVMKVLQSTRHIVFDCARFDESIYKGRACFSRLLREAAGVIRMLAAPARISSW